MQIKLYHVQETAMLAENQTYGNQANIYMVISGMVEETRLPR